MFIPTVEQSAALVAIERHARFLAELAGSVKDGAADREQLARQLREKVEALEAALAALGAV